MARKYIKETISTLENYLNQNLNTYIKAVRESANFDGTDPSDLKIISSVFDNRYEFPKMTIIKKESTFEYGADDKPLIHPWIDNKIGLLVEHYTSDLVSLDNTLMGIQEAVQKLFEYDETCGNNFLMVELGAVSWSEPMTNIQEKKNVQFMEIELRIRNYY